MVVANEVEAEGVQVVEPGSKAAAAADNIVSTTARSRVLSRVGSGLSPFNRPPAPPTPIPLSVSVGAVGPAAALVPGTGTDSQAAPSASIDDDHDVVEPRSRTPSLD